MTSKNELEQIVLTIFSQAKSVSISEMNLSTVWIIIDVKWKWYQFFFKRFIFEKWKKKFKQHEVIGIDYILRYENVK